MEIVQSATRPDAARPQPKAAQLEPETAEHQPDAASLKPDAAQVRWRLCLHAAVLFLVIAVCGRFYFHLALDEHQRLIFSHNPVTYYSQLAEAFRHGQLSLLTPPKPELLALPDPYLPALNAPYRMHDASLYGGKYYLYFGPAPALVLHMPLRWLTGYYPSDAAAVLIFLITGLVFWLAVFHAAIAKWLPNLSLMWTLLGGLALAFCSTGPFVLARPAVYEVCLASSYCFTAIFFKAFLSALTAGDSATSRACCLRLLGAGAALSLAIASRPPALLIAPIAAALLWRGRRERVIRGTACHVRQLLPFALPLAIAGVLLATYNYKRFGNPLEFGQAYQLAGIYLRNLTFFSARRIPTGLQYYLLSGLRTGVEFPFLWTANRTVEGVLEPVAGVLPIYPFLTALLLLPVTLRRGVHAGTGLRPIVIVLTAGGAAQLLLLCCFAGVTMRYELEFGPPLVMAAVLSIGLAAASPSRSSFSSTSRWRWASLVFAPALAVGAHQGCLLGFAGYYDAYETRHPGSTAAIQASLLPVENRLARWFGGYGGLRLLIDVQPGTPGAVQMLASTGAGETENRALIRYTEPGMAQFGCAAHDQKASYGPSVKLQTGGRHTVEIYIGAMYPDSREIYSSWFDPQTYSSSHLRCLVALDAVTVTDIKPFPFSPSAPWRVAANRGGGPSRIYSSERIAAPPPGF